LYFLYWKTDKKKYLGYIFGVFLTMLWSVRFLIEFVKENQEAFEDSMALNMGQILSIPFILLGIYLLLTKSKIHSKNT